MYQDTAKPDDSFIVGDAAGKPGVLVTQLVQCLTDYLELSLNCLSEHFIRPIGGKIFTLGEVIDAFDGSEDVVKQRLLLKPHRGSPVPWRFAG